jgi:ribulose 1,5-bisphosphate synthetase/thiazole synthase
MKSFYKRIHTVLLIILISLSINANEFNADVCVYGGTASGMMAAVVAAKENKTVIIVEPSRWLGGILGGGIRILTDCKYPDDIGGLTKMMLKKDSVLGYTAQDNQAMIRDIFTELTVEYGIKVLFEHRLGEVIMEGSKIIGLKLDYAPPMNNGCPVASATKRNAAQVQAKVYIDASYEGDLMAKAGISYVVARESNDDYNESLGGQRNLQVFEINPYVKSDDPSSGLLPMIDPEPYEEGASSRHIIAYNFRLQWLPEGEGMKIGEPNSFNPEKYALVIRSLKTDPEFISWPSSNYHRYNLISTGIPGRQSDYPDADWKERSKIWEEWIDHVKIMHKITGSKQTLNRGEYPETNDFPHQLYIRMARRMVGEYVMTQHDLMLQTKIKHPIGLGYYMVDIYPCRLIITPDYKVASEGEAAIMVSPGPYQIPYEALIPKKNECTNLLVPVCMSATHVALSSIRMEPTYMIMGEATGIAAVRALNENRAVQEINMVSLKEALLDAGMVLEWDGTGYETEKVYRDTVYWISHPEEYQNRPYEKIYKGKR